MFPQLVIAQYSQYLAAMYVASLFNPANYCFGMPLLYTPPAGTLCRSRVAGIEENPSQRHP